MIEATLSAALLASALLPGSATPVATDIDSLFPPATKAMVVTSGPDSEKFTYYDLVRQYAQATDQEVSMTEATKEHLRSRSVDLSRSFVPVEQVQHTFETLLASAGFVLSPPKVPEVPIIGIWSKEGPEAIALRGDTTFLEADQVARAAKHPAVLFTTTIDLPNTDTRQLANSLRTLIVDSNTQQMVPAGTSNSMVLVGLGEQIAGFAEAVREIDEAAGRERLAFERRAQVITLAHAKAADLARICALVFEAQTEAEQEVVHHGGPRTKSLLIVPDARTNSIVVRGTAEELERVTRLVAELDKKSTEDK
ncbi:MAG: secretin N-terminal domain-containing protein [Planctomycetota bacterium]|nr:secretin N-terminal domain-containing protein [Planctomycetota bacterium]